MTVTDHLEKVAYNMPGNFRQSHNMSINENNYSLEQEKEPKFMSKSKSLASGITIAKHERSLSVVGNLRDFTSKLALKY